MFSATEVVIAGAMQREQRASSQQLKTMSWGGGPGSPAAGAWQAAQMCIVVVLWFAEFVLSDLKGDREVKCSDARCLHLGVWKERMSCEIARGAMSRWPWEGYK